METRMKTAVYRIIAIAVSLILTVSALPASIYLAEGGAIIVNGDFENGTAGFENINAALFEVIAETGNPANHVLHLKGGGKYKQTVTVKKNTDYIWTFRMKKLESQLSVYFDVIAEDGTTNLITAVVGVSSGAYSNMYNGRAAVNVNRDTWGTFSIKFNSGNNTSVALTGDTWTANREYYTDDWVIEEIEKPGDLQNGDFENGTAGFKNISAATFEVITEPGNETNRVLHIKGGGTYRQNIGVDKNTDYIWTLRMKKLDDQQSVYFDVIAEDMTTNLITSVSSSSSGVYTNLYNGRAAVDIDKGLWGTYVIKFNSGNNTYVTLSGDAWTENREYYTDDWTITEEIKTGAVVNGEFDSGTKGYTNVDTATFEVIPEPGNETNNLLHLIGGGSYYQQVKVNKNTDYIWTFRMKDLGGTESTRILVTAADSENSLMSDIMQSGGGYASLNDGGYASVAAYNKAWVTFTVKFNSGDNESIKLIHNTYASDREIYTDDWRLSLEPKGDIINGDFENGTVGYTDGGVSAFEVIREPGNTANHVLHLVGGGSYWQTVKVNKNTDYIWTFRMKDIGNTGSTRILVTAEDGNENLITEFTKDGNGYASLNDGTYAAAATYGKNWVTFTAKFNSGDNEKIRLLHNTWTSNREIYMDDWTFSRPRVVNELLNGGFDEGTKYYDNQNTVIFEAITDPQNGSNSLLHAGDGGKFCQTLLVTPNTDYVWSFKMRSLDSAGNIYADVVSEDNTALTDTVYHVGGTYAQMYNGRAAINSGSGWGTFSIRFNSGNNSRVLLQIDTWTSGRNRYFDDWKISIAAPVGELLNSDFEADDLSAYEPDSYLTSTVTDSAVHSGGGAALLQKGDSDGGGFFYQTVSVEKNTDYIWRLWIKLNNDNTPVGVTVRKTGGANLATKMNGDCDTLIEPSPGFDFHRIRYNDGEWHEYTVFFSSGDSQVTDLAVLLYKANAELVTDDWSLEKIGATADSDTLIDVGFEDENMGCHEITKPCWTVSDEDAHSGTKSIKYDGSISGGPHDLLYLNENGVIADTVGVEKNTLYRFSFWYRGEGDRLDMANIYFRLYSGGSTYNFKGYYVNSDTEWKYAEHVFNSGDKTGYRLLLNGAILGSRKFVMYVDDIKLEKVNVGVNDTEISPSDVTVGNGENLVPTDVNKSLGSSSQSVRELTLRPYGTYSFKVTYTSADANGKIGLASATDGTPLTDGKSIISVTGTASAAQSAAFTFTAPADGKVYLVTSNSAGSVNITDLLICALTPTPQETVEKVELKNPAANKTASIWDEDFDFDFDWNNDTFDDNDFKISDNTVISDGDTEKTAAGRRYQRIKRRKLISKGTSGISTLAVVLICCGSAVVAAAAVTLVIILIRRKKRRNI